MDIRTIANRAAALALGLATWITPGIIQGQTLYDRVDVNLPYTVTIGNQTLQPGQYVIQQLRSASGDSRVLLIYSDNGMKFQTSSLTIPTLDPNTARTTRVILHHFGNDYYFDRIWIQGKDYGYEFPLPNSVKSREQEEMQPVSVAATYTATPPPTEQAQNTPPPAPAPEPAPAQAAPAPAPEQNAAPAPEPAPAPAPAPEEPQANRSMPTTASGWLTMLLAGFGLSAAGLLLLRRKLTA
jgi:hypothetical protein